MRTASTFSAGVRSASTSSTPITAPTVSATATRSPVTMTIRSIPPRRSSRMVRLRIGSDGVGEHEETDRLAVDTHVDGDCSLELGTRGAPRGPGGDRGEADPFGFPHPHLMAIDAAEHPVARDLFDLRRERQSEAAALAARTTAVARTWGET